MCWRCLYFSYKFVFVRHWTHCNVNRWISFVPVLFDAITLSLADGLVVCVCGGGGGGYKLFL